MKIRKPRLIAASAVAVIAAGGYFIYGLMAAQGQGVLAQSPMNTQTQIPAAFIMAVDDSGSMRFQTLFPGSDGTALWDRENNNSPYGFFHSSGAYAGKIRGMDPTSTTRQFVHVAPYPAPRQAAQTNDNAAIPPIDAFGFSRSHVYNAAYFNPNIEYVPWRNANGTSWAAAVPAATRIDPNVGDATVNLTAVVEGTTGDLANNMAFRFRTGMVLPAGLKFNGTGCGLANNNSTASTPANWRTLNANFTATGDCNLYVSYFPATFYLPVNAPLPTDFIENRRVLATNACSYTGATGANACNMYRYEIRPDNYASTAAYNAAITNFANWFSYYGARNRSMISAMSNSLAMVNNLKVGYFTINNRQPVTMRNLAVAADKAALYSSIYGLGASGQTPNLQAVQYIGEQFRRTDAGAPISLMCQKNAGMLFTDGFSNDSVGNIGNVDANMGVPFADRNSNTMADIAARYYLDTAAGGLAPLRSGGAFTAGQVPIPAACSTLSPASMDWKRLDCQPNLHMNFYGVTLGARGNVFDPDVDRDPFVDPVAWPGTGGGRSTVDDIWHASINTRGEFINARTPADITAAMRRVLSSVSAADTPSGSLALTGSRVGTGSLTVTPRYEVANEGTDWFSRLTASRLAVNPTTRLIEETPAWEASGKFPLPADRNIFVSRAGVVSTFTEATISLADLCTKPAGYEGMSRCSQAELTALGASAASAVNYLRGNTASEVRNNGRFRNRTALLGDIVNSGPVVSSPVDDFGYRSLGDGFASSYASYLETKRSGGRYMVYVGANDGMLHAFDGGMTAAGVMDATAGGVEKFAYIPATALGHMGNLLFPYDPLNRNDQKFDHRYYVDGPITVGDAFYGNQWHTSLVGTAGAGGRSVFALDVSAAGAFAATNRLWEISDLDMSLPQAVRDNIGHVLGKPVIVPVKTVSGAVSWKAIFGNGYNSASGKAVLFVVDLASGTPTIRMIEAVESSATAPSGSNGLGNIVVVDRWNGAALDKGGRDGYADTVYAADQKGAVWKFDLRSTANSVSTPVFTSASYTETGGTATYRQPITGGLLATTGSGGGVMLVFGTGSFSFVSDPADTSVQSLYGVNDLSQGAVVSTTIRPANLQPYTVTTSGSLRQTRAGTVPVGAAGWAVQLPAGERFVGYPNIASGVVFMPTYAPQQGSTGCITQGFNWLFGLNARTGAPAMSNVRFGSTTGSTAGAGTAAVSLNTQGTAAVKDVSVAVVPRLQPPALVPGANPPAPPASGCWMNISAAGSDPMYMPYPCGRQSWRQLQ